MAPGMAVVPAIAAQRAWENKDGQVYDKASDNNNVNTQHDAWARVQESAHAPW